MTDQWMAEHKGPHLKTVGYVWECEDDECGCSQAVVVSYYRNKVVPNARVPINDWAGDFYTDHESGADLDLAEYRRHLKATEPEREAEIEWQQGVDYDRERPS